MKSGRLIRSVMAYLAMLGTYGISLIASKLLGVLPRRKWRQTGRIAVTATFFNPNWYLSHITPLTRCGCKEVILVAGKPQSPLEKVRFACPPLWLSRVCSRAGAKFLWLLIVGVRYRLDLYMGYHIFPGACSALLAARLFGRPACYQMTGGPTEVLGGGYKCENRVMSSLRGPSPLLERLATAVVREFDLVVVRGSKAKAFLAERGINRTVAVITGSTSPRSRPTGTERQYDLVFVGRMTETKQPQQFIEIAATVSKAVPRVRGIVVGDGPLFGEVQRKADESGLADRIEFLGQRADVDDLVAQSRVFVLTSRSEGLSIAMIEAMAAGTVPVVADVGELGDLVQNGRNGFLVEPGAIDRFAERVIVLLSDHGLWTRLSQAAAETAARNCAGSIIAERWGRCLQEAIGRRTDSAEAV